MDFGRKSSLSDETWVDVATTILKGSSLGDETCHDPNEQSLVVEGTPFRFTPKTLGELFFSYRTDRKLRASPGEL